MKEEINLLKPEQSGSSSFGFAKKSTLSLYIVAGLFAVEILAWGGLWFYNRSIDERVASAAVKSSSLDLEISKNEPNLQEAIGHQLRLANLGSLLESHVFWSPVFEELGKYTQKSIFYETFDGDAASSLITVSGTAASFTDIAKLILGLKQSDNFFDVAFQSEGPSTGEKTGFAFILEIKFDPALLKK